MTRTSFTTGVHSEQRWRGLRAGMLPLLLAVALLTACESKDQVAAARASMAKGDYAAAIVSLRFAAQQSPQSVPVRLLLAEALERRHDIAGAAEQLRKAVENGGKTDELLPRIALLMLDRQEAEALVRDYKDRRLDDAQADASLRGAVALALLQLKREPAARQQLAEAAAVPTVRLAQAQMLVNAGRAKDALALLELERTDVAPPWWLLRAARRIAVAAGEPALSLDLMRRAHEAVPWNLGVLGEYGEVLISVGRFDEAEKVREQLARTAPQSYWTHYLGALLFSRVGRVDEAHVQALAVLKGAPEHTGATLIAASTELQRADVKMAEQRLSGLVQRQPELVPALRLLAQARLRLGRGDEALETVQRGLRLLPGDPELLLVRGRVEMGARQFKAAAETFAEVAARHPEDVELQLLLAQARTAQGDRAGAGEVIDRLQPKIADGAFGARVVQSAIDLGDRARAQRLAQDLAMRFPSDAQARLAQAATQVLQGDMASAWKQTLAVLDDKPAHGGALMALASMARTPQQRAELLARHDKALQAGGGGPQQVLDYATLLRLDAGATLTPLAVLERGAKLYPTSPGVLRALVEEVLRSGDTARAIGVAQGGAAVANAPVAMREILAETYARVGKREQAAEALRKLVAEFAQRADWTLELAQLEAQAGRTTEAVSLLRRVVSERPDDAGAYRLLALQSARNNVEEGLSVARQLGTRPGFEAAALLLAGDVQIQAGQPVAALEQYRAATKAGAQPAGNLRSLDALDRNGRQAVADQELARLLQTFPEHASVLGYAAARAQRQGAPAKAVEYLQRIARKAPHDPVLLNDLAWAQLAAGQPEALANARKAVMALPNNANVLHTWGMALARSGKSQEAIAALQAAANLAPSKALPKLNLAQVMAEAGNKTGAAAALRGLDEEQLGAKDKDELRRLQEALKG